VRSAAAALPDAVAYIPKRTERSRGWGESTEIWFSGWGTLCGAKDLHGRSKRRHDHRERKREALYTYEGSRGYQPMLAVWAEMDVVLADEFRDGNVPAQMAPLTGGPSGLAAAPKTVTSYYYRGDAALPREGVVALVVERETRRRAGGIHWLCGQRADERGVARGDREFRSREWKAYGSRSGRGSGMREVVFVSNEEWSRRGRNRCATWPSGCGATGRIIC